MQIFTLIFPIFAIILTGYACARFNILPAQAGDSLIQFVFFVGIPAMLVVAIGQQNPAELLNWTFIAIFGGSVLAVFVLVLFAARLFFGTDFGAATMIAMICVASNTGIIGLPLLHSLLGHKAVALAALANIIVVALLLIQIILLEESVPGEEEKSTSTKLKHIKNAFLNPIVLSTLVGLVFAFTPLTIPVIFANYLNILGSSVAACALFAVGMSIKPASLFDSGPVILFASSIKLIGLAVIVFVLTQIFGLSPLLSTVAVVSAALPTAKSEFVLAKQYHEEEEVVAETVSFTTALSVVTLFIWLLILSYTFPGTFSV